jgi:hypothetical protein
MNLEALLRDISPDSLVHMASELGQRSEALAKESPSWSRLYGFLSIEMDAAAIGQRTGISL